MEHSKSLPELVYLTIIFFFILLLKETSAKVVPYSSQVQQDDTELLTSGGMNKDPNFSICSTIYRPRKTP